MISSTPIRHNRYTSLIPAICLLAAFSFSVKSPAVLPAMAAQGGRLLDSFPWIIANRGEDSLLLRLSDVEPGSYELYELDSPPRIVVDIPGRTCESNRAVHESYDFGGGLLVQLRATCSEERTRVVLESRYPLYWEVVSDERYTGLNILCYTRFRQSVEEIVLDEGSTYFARRYVSPVGQRFVHAVVSDPTRSRLRPQVLLASDVTTRGLASVDEFVHGCGAAVGINGGYYIWPGISLSLVIQNSQIVAPPQLHRPAFMVLDNGSYRISYPRIHALVSSAYGIEWEATLVNQSPQHGEIALLTPGHPERIRGDMPGVKAVILDGVVQDVTNGEIEDFADRHILWSRRQYPPLELLRIGETVDIRMEVASTAPPTVWALQGGPFLVYDGRVHVTAEQDDIGNDIARGRSARTAVGIDNRGRLYLVYAEGPESGRSMGSTLQELAWTMLDLGATYAMNLDGGSSSSMALGFARPETGITRGTKRIATALVLIDESGRMQGESFFF